MKGPKGPEAGVRVIAETTDLPTRFARIVVSDGAGRPRPGLPAVKESMAKQGNTVNVS